MYKYLKFKAICSSLVLAMLYCTTIKAVKLRDSSSLKALYNSAINKYEVDDLNIAKKYLDSILIGKSGHQKDNYPEYNKVYNFLGVINKKQGNLQEAIHNYQLAIRHTSNEHDLPWYYINLANIYVLRGNYLDSQSYLEKALSILQYENEKNYELIAAVYHNLAFSFSSAGNLEKSLSYYKKSLEVSQNKLGRCDGETYYSLGSVYRELDSLESAELFIQRSLQCNKNYFGNTHYQTAMSYLNYANFLVDIGQTDKGLDLYKRALEILKNSVGEKHLYTSDCYKYIGDVYNKQNNFNKALVFYQRALNSKLTDFDHKDIYINPQQEEFPDLGLIEILKVKSTAFEELSKIIDEEGNLKAALTTLELAIYYGEKLKRGYLHEKEKLKLAESRHSSYLAVVRIAYNLHKLTGRDTYVRTAFKYADLSKYSITLEIKNERAARFLVNIPDSIIQAEKLIKEQISDLRIMINAENKTKLPNNEKIRQWKNELFSLSLKREEIIKNIEIKFPEYVGIKESFDVVDVKSFRGMLAKTDVAIEYVTTSNYLYSFLISRDAFEVNRLLIDSTFHNSVNYLIEFLNSTTYTDYDEYRYRAHFLYQKLIEPYEKFLCGRNILIIPDGKLSLLAFETLVDESHKPTLSADYSTVPYLIKKYPIGYALSASLYAESLTRKKHKTARLLGFAPNYKMSTDSLTELPLTRRSLRKIGLITKGNNHIGRNATKENFTNKAGEYEILHLYLHGFEDTLTPSLSHMFFHKSKSKNLVDSKLHAYEIENLELKADLVVLPACYSGSGQISKGEGVLSIGRSFLNGGSSSIIMSLWRSAYKPTIQELDVFYWQLVNGKRKDKALQIAKLKYIQNADSYRAHPRFWASNVVVGNQEAMFPKSNFWKTKFLLWTGCLLILILLIKIRRRFWKLFRS